MNTIFGIKTYELHYWNIPKKILAEQLIQDSKGECNDYKFLCFDGIPRYVWVDTGRFDDHRRNVYNMEWNQLPLHIKELSHTDVPIPKPKNFDRMIVVAKILSEGFHHVRVDLYNAN